MSIKKQPVDVGMRFRSRAVTLHKKFNERTFENALKKTFRLAVILRLRGVSVNKNPVKGIFIKCMQYKSASHEKTLGLENPLPSTTLNTIHHSKKYDLGRILSCTI